MYDIQRAVTLKDDMLALNSFLTRNLIFAGKARADHMNGGSEGEREKRERGGGREGGKEGGGEMEGWLENTIGMPSRRGSH